jgi:hypothetical protein
VCYETLEPPRQLSAIKHGNIPQNAGDEARGDGPQAPGNLLEKLWDCKPWHELEIARPRGTRRAAEVTNAPNAKRGAQANPAAASNV